MQTKKTKKKKIKLTKKLKIIKLLFFIANFKQNIYLCVKKKKCNLIINDFLIN